VLFALSFIGDGDIAMIREEFLSLRSQLFRFQRPFKFHLHTIPGFTKPDRNWGDNEKAGIRKCKQIFFSLDNISEDPSKPLSQSDYKSQVTTFVHHLQKIFPDETSPIWVMTMNTHPSLANDNCHTPVLPRTTDHPCNDALHDLFSPSQRHVFQDRVKLMDNTDLMLPLWSTQKSNMLSIIALRLYVLIGWQVAQWRAVGQVGTRDGVQKGNVLDPNKDLGIYTGWD
jgi:hypothetical protein